MANNLKLTALSNGIRLLYNFEKPPVVYCGFAVNAGTRDENPNEHGIAHLIEHLLFRGTKNRTNIQIINCLEEIGGELNAYTTKEETFIYAIVPEKYTERAFSLLSDIIFNSTFAENHLKKECEVICEEIDMYNDTPSELIFDEFENLAFKNSSLEHNILGTKKSLAKVTGNDCLNFIKRCYTTDNLLFFLQGNISEEKFIRLSEKYFSYSESKKEYKRELPQKYNPQTVEIHKNTNQIHCLIGNLTYSCSDKNIYALNLLNNIIGGGMLTSKLNLAVRERYGLVYSIDSSLNLYSDTGIWNVYFGCSSENYNRCIDLIYKELQKITQRELSENQLKKYKQQFCGQMLINAQNRENYILATAKTALHLNKTLDLHTTFEKINLISASQIKNIAIQLFDIKNFTILKYF